MDIDTHKTPQAPPRAQTMSQSPTTLDTPVGGVIDDGDSHFLIQAPSCLAYMLCDASVVHEAPKYLARFHAQLASLPPSVRSLRIEVSTLHAPNHDDFCNNPCELDRHVLDDDNLVHHVLRRLPPTFVGDLDVTDFIPPPPADGSRTCTQTLGPLVARHLPKSLYSFKCDLAFSSECVSKLPHKLNVVAMRAESSSSHRLNHSANPSVDVPLMVQLGMRLHDLMHLTISNVSWNRLLVEPLDRVLPKLVSLNVRARPGVLDTHLVQPRALLHLPSSLTRLSGLGVALVTQPRRLVSNTDSTLHNTDTINNDIDTTDAVAHDPLKDFEHWPSFLPYDLDHLDIVPETHLLNRQANPPIRAYDIPSVWTSLPKHLISISLRLHWHSCHVHALLYDTCRRLCRVKLGVSFEGVQPSALPSSEDLFRAMVFGRMPPQQDVCMLDNGDGVHACTNVQKSCVAMDDDTLAHFPASRLEHIHLVLEGTQASNVLNELDELGSDGVSTRLDFPYAISPALKQIHITGDWDDDFIDIDDECDERARQFWQRHVMVIGQADNDRRHGAYVTTSV